MQQTAVCGLLDRWLQEDVVERLHEAVCGILDILSLHAPGDFSAIDWRSTRYHAGHPDYRAIMDRQLKKGLSFERAGVHFVYTRPLLRWAMTDQGMNPSLGEAFRNALATLPAPYPERCEELLSESEPEVPKNAAPMLSRVNGFIALLLEYQAEILRAKRMGERKTPEHIIANVEQGIANIEARLRPGIPAVVRDMRRAGIDPAHLLRFQDDPHLYTLCDVELLRALLDSLREAAAVLEAPEHAGGGKPASEAASTIALSSEGVHTASRKKASSNARPKRPLASKIKAKNWAGVRLEVEGKDIVLVYGPDGKPQRVRLTEIFGRQAPPARLFLFLAANAGKFDSRSDEMYEGKPKLFNRHVERLKDALRHAFGLSGKPVTRLDGVLTACFRISKGDAADTGERDNWSLASHND